MPVFTFLVMPAHAGIHIPRHAGACRYPGLCSDQYSKPWMMGLRPP
jgi:hypothetical protein